MEPRLSHKPGIKECVSSRTVVYREELLVWFKISGRQVRLWRWSIVIAIIIHATTHCVRLGVAKLGFRAFLNFGLLKALERGSAITAGHAAEEDAVWPVPRPWRLAAHEDPAAIEI